MKRVLPDHDAYRDAVALCRATHNGDDDGIITIVEHCHPGLMVQALVRLHLGLLATLAQDDRASVDAYLVETLAKLANEGER